MQTKIAVQFVNFETCDRKSEWGAKLNTLENEKELGKLIANLELRKF